jgi:TIR domain
MAYEYDIFISYRRQADTHLWITKHFAPRLEARVELELGRRPAIFVDDQIESGTSWPASLGEALGTSRILIPLWTRTFLSSAWCAAELSHMLGREADEGLRKNERQHGVIVPAFIHDGDTFPPELSHITYFEIQRTYIAHMPRDGRLAARLESALAAQAPAIAKCIEKAPPWREAWPRDAATQFFALFYQKTEPLQATTPRLMAP